MALPKQRKIVRPPVVDTSKPNKECKNCAGKGCYPTEEVRGLHITIRLGKSTKPPIPCKFCHA